MPRRCAFRSGETSRPLPFPSFLPDRDVRTCCERTVVWKVYFQHRIGRDGESPPHTKLLAEKNGRTSLHLFPRWYTDVPDVCHFQASSASHRENRWPSVEQSHIPYVKHAFGIGALYEGTSFSGKKCSKDDHLFCSNVIMFVDRFDCSSITVKLTHKYDISSGVHLVFFQARVVQP